MDTWIQFEDGASAPSVAHSSRSMRAMVDVPKAVLVADVCTGRIRVRQASSLSRFAARPGLATGTAPIEVSSGAVAADAPASLLAVPAVSPPPPPHAASAPLNRQAAAAHAHRAPAVLFIVIDVPPICQDMALDSRFRFPIRGIASS